MAFPTSPSDTDQYTNALGTVYQYLTADDKWYIITDAATKAYRSMDSVSSAGWSSHWGWGMSALNATTEYTVSLAGVDTSQDAIVHFVSANGSGNCGHDRTWYCTKTDESENANIIYGPTRVIINTDANQYRDEEITISAADMDADNILHIYFILKAGASMYFSHALLEYTPLIE